MEPLQSEAQTVIECVLAALRALGPVGPLGDPAREHLERLFAEAQGRTGGEPFAEAAREPDVRGGGIEAGEGPVLRWTRTLVREAVADGFASWLDGLGYGFGLGDADIEADELERAAALVARRLVSTLELVLYVRGCASAEGRDAEGGATAFLRRQAYRSEGSAARYEIQFLAPFPEGRVYLEELSEIDLADLLGVADVLDIGIYLRRPVADKAGELGRLEEAVRQDLFFDYGEDEVDLEVEHLENGIFLQVREC